MLATGWPQKCAYYRQLAALRQFCGGGRAMAIGALLRSGATTVRPEPVEGAVIAGVGNCDAAALLLTCHCVAAEAPVALAVDHRYAVVAATPQ